MLDHDDNTTFGNAGFPAGSMMNDASQAPQPSAIIGSKIRFKGELVGEEDLIVQGTVDGTIDLKGHNLTVGKEGTLNANVTAKTITVEGKVEGDMFGEDKITIKASSYVRGNIVAARVNLEDGAKFKGSIDMDVDAQGSKTAKPVPMKTEKTETPTALDGPYKKSDNQVEKHKPKLQ